MNSPLMDWLNRQNAGQQPQQPQTPPEMPPQQPNGALVAEKLRSLFGNGTEQGNFLGQFASPFLGMLENINFSNKGRTPEGRAEIKARIDARRAAHAGQPPSERAVQMREKIGQMFQGFKNGGAQS